MLFLCFPSSLFCFPPITSRTGKDPSDYWLQDDGEKNTAENYYVQLLFLSVKLKLFSKLLSEKFSLSGNGLCMQLARQYMHKLEMCC